MLIGCHPRRLWAADYPWGQTLEQRQSLIESLETGWGSWGSVDWAAVDLQQRAPSVDEDERFRNWCFVRRVLTHGEYDTDEWKNDP